MKRGNRIKSRLLSAFLVLVMLVTMVPSWAFADPVTKPQEKQMQSEATSLEGKEEDFLQRKRKEMSERLSRQSRWLSPRPLTGG